MDDETFRKEVLDRLRQIMEMLSFLLPEACVEEAEEIRPVEGHAAARESAGYSIENEMQENFRFAMKKWEEERGRG